MRDRAVEQTPKPFAGSASIAGGPLATARNIVALRLDNIGDVIMTGPALRALKAARPDARLTLLASPAGTQAAPLLPWIDDVFTWRALWQDLGGLAFDPDREWEFIEQLRSRRFDAAIIFTSFRQTPHAAGYACYLAGIPIRAGESKETGGATLTLEVPPAPDDLHQVDRNLRLVEALGAPAAGRRLTVEIPAAARDAVRARLAARGIPLDRPYVVLNPWASCPSRTYPTERFADAARDLAGRTGLPIVVTGVEKDRPRTAPLLARLGSAAVDFLGATSLPELAALIAGARLTLTNNTSTMHLADATGCPAVVLFAGTELERQWRPRHTPARLLRRPTSCNPCYAFTCRYNLECLDIPPEEVVAAALDLLAATRMAETDRPRLAASEAGR